MSGNVFEWCQNLFQPYRCRSGAGGEEPDSNETRVLRGGSWFTDRLDARCACRLRFDPDVHDFNFGFRLVLAPALPAADG
jgi:formylglycine-generating enzyme required for sulfatase activity